MVPMGITRSETTVLNTATLMYLRQLQKHERKRLKSPDPERPGLRRKLAPRNSSRTFRQLQDQHKKMQRNGLLLRGNYIAFYIEELKGAELRRNFENFENFELSLSVPISCRSRHPFYQRSRFATLNYARASQSLIGRKEQQREFLSLRRSRYASQSLGVGKLKCFNYIFQQF